ASLLRGNNRFSRLPWASVNSTDQPVRSSPEAVFHLRLRSVAMVQHPRVREVEPARPTRRAASWSQGLQKISGVIISVLSFLAGCACNPTSQAAMSGGRPSQAGRRATRRRTLVLSLDGRGAAGPETKRSKPAAGCPQPREGLSPGGPRPGVPHAGSAGVSGPERSGGLKPGPSFEGRAQPHNHTTSGAASFRFDLRRSRGAPGLIRAIVGL